MCGITGILHFDDRAVARENLQRMTDALAHRGPDGQGLFVQGRVGLGHRRLAIIDLAGSPQPMLRDERFVITYNGELYNYVELRDELARAGLAFHTQGDTEVILAAWAHWGDDCVRRFRGMFAFCVVDLHTRQYLLARDHFGIKPLLIAQSPFRLAFASEFSALRALDDLHLSGDLQAIESFLRFQYIPGHETVFNQIRHLPPGHTLSGSLDNPPVAPVAFWRPEFVPDAAPTPAQWLERADAVIRDSVRAHLVADVPVGVFVSGGIDSSLVAWKVHELGAGPRYAFSMGFDDAGHSELPWARQVADRLGIEPRTGIATEEFWGELPRLVAHFGQPFGDSSMIPTWQVAQLARRDVTVVLSGDAGDEAFGGYSSYAAFNALPRLRDYWRRLRRSLSARELGALCWALGRRLGLQRPRRAEWERVVEYIGHERRRKLWRPEFRALVDQPCPGFARAQADTRELTAFAQAMDFQTYLPGCVLTKVDIATMFHGLEARTPLLDIEVVRFAQVLPLDMRLRDAAVGKAILKDLLARLMGPEFVHRRKQGFGIPRGKWFLPGRPGRRLFDEVVSDPAARLQEWFDPAAILQAASEHGADRDRSGMMWLMLVLGLWRRQNAGIDFAR